jgi:hypothetical protein
VVWLPPVGNPIGTSGFNAVKRTSQFTNALYWAFEKTVLPIQKRDRPVPLLGSHCSIAGGYYKAIDEAQRVGCDVVQIFTHK